MSDLACTERLEERDFIPFYGFESGMLLKWHYQRCMEDKEDIRTHRHRYLVDENGIVVAEVGEMGMVPYNYMEGWTSICFQSEFRYSRSFTSDCGAYIQLMSSVKLSAQRELETIYRGKKRIQPPIHKDGLGIGSETPVWEDPKHPGWRKWKRSMGYNMDDYRLQKPVKW